jgi:uncharacterized membrane protein YcaP (DUF421 family)
MGRCRWSSFELALADATSIWHPIYSLTLTLVYSTALATLSYNMQIIAKTLAGKTITLEVDNAKIQDNEE